MLSWKLDNIFTEMESSEVFLADILILSHHLQQIKEAMTNVHSQSFFEDIYAHEVICAAGFAFELPNCVEFTQILEHFVKLCSWFSSLSFLCFFEQEVYCLLGHHDVIAFISDSCTIVLNHSWNSWPSTKSSSSNALSYDKQTIHRVLGVDKLHAWAKVVENIKLLKVLTFDVYHQLLVFCCNYIWSKRHCKHSCHKGKEFHLLSLVI